jgi:hypothetical protein
MLEKYGLHHPTFPIETMIAACEPEIVKLHNQVPEPRLGFGFRATIMVLNNSPGHYRSGISHEDPEGTGSVQNLSHI